MSSVQGILEVVPEEDVPGGESTVFVASGETIGHSALCFIVPEPRIESAIAVSKCLLLQICRRDICDAFTDEDDLSSFELSVLGDRARLPQIVLHQEANALFVSFLASSPAVPHSLRHVPVGLFPLFDRLRKLNKRISDEQMSQIRAEVGHVLCCIATLSLPFIIVCVRYIV